MEKQSDNGRTSRFVSKAIASVAVCAAGAYGMYLTNGNTGIGWTVLGLIGWAVLGLIVIWGS